MQIMDISDAHVYMWHSQRVLLSIPLYISDFVDLLFELQLRTQFSVSKFAFVFSLELIYWFRR